MQREAPAMTVRQMDDEFAATAGEFAQAFAAIPEPGGLAILDEAVRAARGRSAE